MELSAQEDSSGPGNSSAALFHAIRHADHPEEEAPRDEFLCDHP
jgi:hypothetical protein